MDNEKNNPNQSENSSDEPINETVYEAEESSDEETKEKTADEEVKTAESSEEGENSLTADSAENTEERTVKRISAAEMVRRGIAFILNMSLPHLLMRLVGSYFMAAAYFIFVNGPFSAKESVIRPVASWEQYRDKVSLITLCIIAAVLFIIISILKYKLPRTRLDSYFMITGFVLFSVASLWRNENIYLVIVLTIITGVFGYIGFRYDSRNAEMKIPFWGVCVITGLLAVFVAGTVAASTIVQYRSYGTSCYDMGIFVQMYHSMINDLSLVTTCERGEFLSHFAIHCSPIYYILLPFYYLFPYAETLLVAQAVMIAIGVIPLIGICRSYKFGNVSIILFSITYLFCAELIGPCYYHFHENAFLPPLLMWLFYAIEKKKPVLMYIFMAMVLMVKEDAPVYIVCIGMYLIFQKNKTGIRKHGAIMAGIAGIYFVTVTSLMKKYGEGVMTSRTYGNLMIDKDAGFGEIIKTVILNPAYFFSQLVREDTLIFFLTVMVPLGFMPLITKKYSNLWLFVPFLLMNLASGYYYASQTGFQYVFGTSACLIYAVIINTAALSEGKRKLVPAYTAMATVYMAVSVFSGGIAFKYEWYSDNRERFDNQDEIMESIPADASVIADTWYVPALAQRKEVYEMSERYLYEEFEADYVIVRLDTSWEYKQDIISKLETEGYSKYCELENVMEVYVSPEYVNSKNMKKK